MSHYKIFSKSVLLFLTVFTLSACSIKSFVINDEKIKIPKDTAKKIENTIEHVYFEEDIIAGCINPYTKKPDLIFTYACISVNNTILHNKVKINEKKIQKYLLLKLNIIIKNKKTTENLEEEKYLFSLIKQYNLSLNSEIRKEVLSILDEHLKEIDHTKENYSFQYKTFIHYNYLMILTQFKNEYISSENKKRIMENLQKAEENAVKEDKFVMRALFLRWEIRYLSNNTKSVDVNYIISDVKKLENKDGGYRAHPNLEKTNSSDLLSTRMGLEILSEYNNFNEQDLDKIQKYLLKAEREIENTNNIDLVKIGEFIKILKLKTQKR
ncbi:hypothetical protein [Bacillus sp. UNCCL81]|uniref:hypothetical protein n=1 Tax=Bacillus sp. UNCCL81 TaxID=1502755 RepID=UPI0008F41F9E|nr:hypothetical protein [Bacillus sp. UNCCL81]SFD61552.1 hypothetical protein SAMN02799633_04294 [Bacillus sp. UNCCL81]